MKRGCIYLILCAGLPASAQFNKLPSTADYITATAYSTLQSDALSFTGNPAALASVKKISAALWGDRRFGLAALASYRAAIAVPGKRGGAGIALDYFGNAFYNESGGRLAYSRKMSKADVGIQFGYRAARAAGYESNATVEASAGAIFHLTEKLSAGLRAGQVTGIGGEKDNGLSLHYSAGFGYDASERFFIGFELQKDPGRAINAHASIQYGIGSMVIVRAGLASAASSFYFGAGFLWKGIRIDACSSVHPYLGLTPGLMLTFKGVKQ